VICKEAGRSPPFVPNLPTTARQPRGDGASAPKCASIGAGQLSKFASAGAARKRGDEVTLARRAAFAM
jgi:hypothetical protein